MNRKITLQILLSKINYWSKHKKQDFLLLFDLDDTIFDTSIRRFYAYDRFLRIQFNLPKLAFSQLRFSYDFTPFIQHSSLYNDQHSIIHRCWNKFFTSNNLLFLDTPYLKMLYFFNAISCYKVAVIFLTARPEVTMKTATLNCLKKYGFVTSKFLPDSLVMKTSESLIDSTFKKLELKRILNLYSHQKIIIIDNDSKNCSDFNKILPHDSIVVHFNSVEKRRYPYDGFLLNP